MGGSCSDCLSSRVMDETCEPTGEGEYFNFICEESSPKMQFYSDESCTYPTYNNDFPLVCHDAEECNTYDAGCEHDGNYGKFFCYAEDASSYFYDPYYSFGTDPSTCDDTNPMIQLSDIGMDGCFPSSGWNGAVAAQMGCWISWDDTTFISEAK